MLAQGLASSPVVLQFLRQKRGKFVKCHAMSLQNLFQARYMLKIRQV